LSRGWSRGGDRPIAVERAAGRPEDLEAIAELEAVQEDRTREEMG